MPLMHDWTIDNWPPMLTLVAGASIMVFFPLVWTIIGLIVDGLRAPPQPARTGAGRRLSRSLLDPDRKREHRELSLRSAASFDWQAASHRTTCRRAGRRGGAW
jgi:hypothetical protein